MNEPRVVLGSTLVRHSQCRRRAASRQGPVAGRSPRPRRHRTAGHHVTARLGGGRTRGPGPKAARNACGRSPAERLDGAEPGAMIEFVMAVADSTDRSSETSRFWSPPANEFSTESWEEIPADQRGEFAPKTSTATRFLLLRAVAPTPH
jgi:hypothetical protein